MSDKEFITANDLVKDSFSLAKIIFDSAYRPEVILVLWRGGTPVGIVVHEYLLYKGVRAYHTAVKAESYVGIDKRVEPSIEHLDIVLEKIPEQSRVLIVDDIFDSGCTIRKTMELLSGKTSQVRSATLYYKMGNSAGGLKPDYFLRKTDKWIVFPHELMDLTEAEIRQKAPYIGEVL